MEGEGTEAKPVKPPRTHWDMLRERRSIDELEKLLNERLDMLKQRRRIAAKMMKEQKEAEEKAKSK